MNFATLMTSCGIIIAMIVVILLLLLGARQINISASNRRYIRYFEQEKARAYDLMLIEKQKAEFADHARDIQTELDLGALATHRKMTVEALKQTGAGTRPYPIPKPSPPKKRVS